MASFRPTLSLGILAHVDAGKTSLTERLLFETGVLHHPGSVDAGTTQTDTMALERRRGITIRTAVACFVVGGVQVNLVDTPGHSDFVAEVERALAVLDAAVLVVSGVEGVQAQSLVLFRALRRMGIPTVFFVNKADRPTARPGRVIGEIRERLTTAVIPVADPDALAEALAEHDDQVLAALVGDRPAYPVAQLQGRLSRLTARGTVHPAYVGSAITGAGVPELIRGLVALAPAAADPCGPPSGAVFKIERGDARERIVFLRMRGGTVRVRDRVDLGHGPERVTGLRVFAPGGAVAAGEVSAGQIAQVRGLERARVGDTFGPAARREAVRFVRPSLETVVEPVDPDRCGALFAALTELAEQDPLIDVRQDDGRREISLSLYGEVQKEVIASLLAAEYDVAARFRASTPLCIERVVGTGAAAELIGTPANPFLATVGLRVGPGAVGSGVRFGLEVELGSMPPAFFAAVEESVRATLTQGPHGWQVPDCAVVVTHSGYYARHSLGHAAFTKSISSTAADFRYLAALVLMTALRRAGTVVCEPVHHFELELPEPAYAAVLAMLPTVGGVPLETTQRGGRLVVTGEVPAVGVHTFQQRVPDLTRGEGVLTTALDHYRPVSAEPPTRARTDDDPTDRVGFLKATTRRVGRTYR
ncbi:MAG TPA: translation factor GTPase family protein [Dermatophilaceae bacterium]|nr:translation factor GTPase family protein [Dermatophilaceae bacterium]